MDTECIFCRIAAGEAEASIVFESDAVVAFMDVRAFHPGHTLVVPRRHVPDIMALDDDALAGALLSIVARVARAVQATFAASGISVWQSNGPAAGQEVLHLHIHVVPRYENDGLLRVYPSKPDYPSRSELDAHALTLRAAIAAAG
jgi:histidine triad (HIT) family protein